MAHGGVKDLKKHENTALHSRSERSTVGALPLSSYYGPVRKSAVLEAEVKFGYFLGEHHLAFNIADHASKLFCSMFPDSAIAKEFKCGRTKATAVLKAIAEDAWESIQNAVKDSKYFSIQTDETTDLTVNQQMAIMLGFFDNSCGAVRCVFFKLEAVPRATAEQLYELIDKHFQGSDILNYEHLVGLGTDGANVMLGQRNSVMSRLREKQPGLIALHCNCHIAALIANASCKELPDCLEELTTDIWYYFHKSSKRLREFENFQCFVNVKPHKLLKACQTRWLSLEACVNRLVEQYDALLSYFRSTENRTAAVKRISAVLEKPITKAYLLFLSVSLPIINNFNKCMQKQAPLVHLLQQELESLIRKLMLRFMQVKCVTDSTDVTTIDVNDSENFLPLEEVFVKHQTMKYVEDEVSLATSDIHQFREHCQAWWATAVKEAIRRLPLGHALLCNSHWLQPGLQQYEMLSQILCAAACLPQVVKTEEKSVLQEEFIDYCMYAFSDEVKERRKFVSIGIK